ncbi:MAG: hypothetical protein LBP21_06990 [Synergistaceae bacterium]|jgi:hypothetical protein|nr:hypothetical protein [Synergistaceae bacterium]
MKASNVDFVVQSRGEDFFGYNFGYNETDRLRKAVGSEIHAVIQVKEAEKEEAALRKVEEAQSGNTDATLKMMDRHNEMVKKSQELYKAKAKQRAIERQNTQRREEHSEILAEMAIRNAERRDLLEADRLAR